MIDRLQKLRQEALNRFYRYGEPALTIGSSVIAEPVSGLAGIGSLLSGRSVSDAALAIAQAQSAMTYQPRTAQGAQGLQGFQQVMQPIGDVVQGASQNLGDKAYSATGSPLAGAIGYSLPTAMLEGLGLKGLSIARKPVSAADLYSVRMGAGKVDGDKWSFIGRRYSERVPEKSIKSELGEIRFFDASDSDGVFKDAAYYDNDGNVIGTLFSGPDADGKWVGSVEVRPDMRRKGVATALYDEMERLSGAKMKPADKNSEDAKKFWQSRQGNPERKSAASITDKYQQSGVASSISERPSEIVLNKVIVPKESRGSGIGSQFMQELIDYGNQSGKKISLTPSADFGGNKSRLVEFYKRFGFVENKGKNKDYEISEAMYRLPDAAR
jgi:GNAT superfamily N-acetyltransferase